MSPRDDSNRRLKATVSLSPYAGYVAGDDSNRRLKDGKIVHAVVRLRTPG